MKANAPENIYIQPDAQDGWFMVNNLNNTLVKYTRTDAFIEKACKFIKDNGSHYIDIVNGQLVLKKGIIKDFRNYMKGENE